MILFSETVDMPPQIPFSNDSPSRCQSSSSCSTDSYDSLSDIVISSDKSLNHPSIDAALNIDEITTSEESDCSYLSSSTLNILNLKIPPFAQFRLQYLLVHTAIMLADGLQGTHLYVLYESYGYSVASLYSLGFVAGALTSPFIGPIVDKIGRKRSAMLYCILEMFINYLELFPGIYGLIASRMIGGITTNLLFSVFESWLVCEHRNRGFEDDKLEIILRDSTIVSNAAAILSGYIAHCLAEVYGNGGPFRGAVGCTFFACMVVFFLWNENFGTVMGTSTLKTTSWKSNMVNAYRIISNDSKIARIGIIQGFTQGSLQTFIFLWSPTLRKFADAAPSTSLGLDNMNEPAYGLLFGAFMTMGVLGGFAEPTLRKALDRISSKSKPMSDRDITSDSVDDHTLNPVTICFMSSFCYTACALLLLVPCALPDDHPYSFSSCLAAFLLYELIIGIYMPCEGVVRSMYIPNETICSIMTMLRIVVNVSVAVGVISTIYISVHNAFIILSALMMISAIIQMTLIPTGGIYDFYLEIGKRLCLVMMKEKKE